jgi:hypothetical protein
LAFAAGRLALSAASRLRILIALNRNVVAVRSDEPVSELVQDLRRNLPYSVQMPLALGVGTLLMTEAAWRKICEEIEQEERDVLDLPNRPSVN